MQVSCLWSAFVQTISCLSKLKWSNYTCTTTFQPTMYLMVQKEPTGSLWKKDWQPAGTTVVPPSISHFRKEILLQKATLSWMLHPSDMSFKTHFKKTSWKYQVLFSLPITGWICLGVNQEWANIFGTRATFLFFRAFWYCFGGCENLHFIKLHLHFKFE